MKVGDRGRIYLTSSPFSFRFRALDNRFRRRVRISSIVEIRKNSPKDSTPYSINRIIPFNSSYHLHDTITLDYLCQHLDEIHVVYSFEQSNQEIEHRLDRNFLY